MSAATPVLSSVVVRGAEAYAAPDLFAVYAEQLGKPIDATAARAIVAALVAKYAADGYSRPVVRVDDGLIGVGVLRLDVTEPRIGEISINGDPGPHRERLQTLGAELTLAQPIRSMGMQTTLRRMRELPGLRVAATTARDPVDPSLYRLDLETEFERVTGAVRLSNRGTREAGPHFVLGQVAANGLLGGQTNLGVLFGAATDYDEYHGLGLSASVGFGNAGARTSFSGFRSRSNPHEATVDRNDVYVRDRVTLGVQRPVEAVERASLSWSVNLDLDDLEISRDGMRLRDERLRMLEAGASASWRAGARTQYLLTVDVIKGLDGFGSGLAAADLGSDRRAPDFLATRASLVRVTSIGEHWSLRIDALAQQTAYVLPFNERFKIGGDRLGRGFEVTEIAGDQGIGAKVEARRALRDAVPALGRISLYVFYDIGAAWKHDLPGRESAATAGFGAGTRGARTTATLELAQPLTHADVEGQSDLSLFAEIVVRL